jgi:hypothetical protein
VISSHEYHPRRRVRSRGLRSVKPVDRSFNGSELVAGAVVIYQWCDGRHTCRWGGSYHSLRRCHAGIASLQNHSLHRPPECMTRSFSAGGVALRPRRCRQSTVHSLAKEFLLPLVRLRVSRIAAVITHAAKFPLAASADGSASRTIELSIRGPRRSWGKYAPSSWLATGTARNRPSSELPVTVSHLSFQLKRNIYYFF